jgi:pyruvate,orthophosphate dikinase
MQTIFPFGVGCEVSGDAMLLGGKGYHLAKMAADGLPVPPGFTLTTDLCKKFVTLDGESEISEFAEDLMYGVQKQVAALRDKFDYMPLLSVRSGAPVSMPGMMDTILNVGLTSKTLPMWAEKIGDRAAFDSFRRLVQMYGNVVLGIPMEEFEEELELLKEKYGASADTDLTGGQLEELGDNYRDVIVEHGHQFPDSLEGQLMGAIMAVFKSWMNPRAVAYRELNNISADMGTAVNVQMMVFGNMNEESCSGVLFTRDPATGAPGVMGEFLPNAQGEDVVAGIRTPLNLKEMEAWNPEAYEWLMDLAERMETENLDMQDMEFTVQNGQLYILQTRNGKRSAKAAVRIAVDLFEEKLITKKTALKRVSAKQFFKANVPVIDPKFSGEALTSGIPAGGSVVTGRVALSSEAALKMSGNVILVAKETTPEDIKGMNKAVGILTSTGGATSHAAVVARGMDKSCVVGATELVVFGDRAVIGEAVMLEGDVVSIDGATGRVWLGEVPVVDPAEDPYLTTFKNWLLGKKQVWHVVSKVEDIRPGNLYVETGAGDNAKLATILQGLDKATSRVIIDLNPMLEDSALTDMFGGQAAWQEISEKAEILSGFEGLADKVTLYVESVYQDLVKEALPGFSLVNSVGDIKGLLAASGEIMIGAGLYDMAGGKAAGNKLLKMLKAGGAEFEIFNEPVGFAEAVVDSLV